MTTLRIEAAVTFLATEEGGRQTPVFSGYRPDAWFGQRTDTGLEACWGFRFVFPGLPDDAPVPAGDEVTAHMQAAVAGPEDLPVRVGDVFEVREGSTVAARGRVLRVLDT